MDAVASMLSSMPALVNEVLQNGVKVGGSVS